ncbi:hypothetical protein H0O00_00825 [Candidatus Micrarchaeota archaeon]|nr:hypothetical protein [Candidatus Micrarchaeota archaeon]
MRIAVIIFCLVFAGLAFAGSCPVGAKDCFLCGGVDGIPCSSSDSCSGKYVEGVGNVACACPQDKPCACYCPYGGEQPPQPPQPPEEEDICAGVSCPNTCTGTTFYSGGSCDPETGRCAYGSRQTCEAGCNAQKTGCATPVDECAGVSCQDRCVDSEHKIYINGTCDPDAPGSGAEKCVYAETRSCQQCADASTCKEVCDNNIDDDANGKADCADLACAGDPYCKQTVQVKVLDGVHGNPLKRVAVNFYAGNSKEHPDLFVKQGDTKYTDENGMVAFEVDMTKFNKPPVFAYAEVEFRDKDGMLEMRYDQLDKDGVASISSAKFQLPWDKPFEMTIAEGTPGVTTVSQADNLVHDADDISLMYYNFIEIIDFYKNDIGYTPTSKVTVHTFTKEDERCTCCYYYSSREIVIDEKNSLKTDATAPENREWHEYTHHVMDELYGGPQRAAGEVNHAGYKNARTTDSMEESFAELWPAVKGGDDIYGGYHPLNSLTKAWGSQGTDEELAFLDVQWKLKDSVFGGKDKMWDFIATNKPVTVKGYYDALMYAYPQKHDTIDDIFVNHGFFRSKAKGNGKYDPGEPFWDTDEDGSYESGEAYIDMGVPNDAIESSYSVGSYTIYISPFNPYNSGVDEIGTASNYLRPARERRPLFWFNFVKLDARDRSGNPVTDGAYKITFEYSGNCEGRTFEQQAVVEDGKAYVMFPQDLDTCTITAKIVPENYETAEPLVITQEEHDNAVAMPASSEYGMEKAITLGAPRDFCNNDGRCDYGESDACGDCRYEGTTYECLEDAECGEGEYCVSGECSTSREGGACCGSAFLLPLLLGAVLLFRRAPA